MQNRYMYLVTIAAAALACSPAVHIEKDKTVDFGRYKTFAWISNSGEGKKALSGSPEEKRIYLAVSEQLNIRGWTEVKEHPNALVSYDVLLERTLDSQSNRNYTPSASRLYFNPYTRHYGTVFYPSQFNGYKDYNIPFREGTLTITISDAGSDKAIWQGWSSGTTDSRKLDEREAEDLVKLIFKKFPVQVLKRAASGGRE